MGWGDYGFFFCRQVGKDLKDLPADTKVVDATGKYVIPGEKVVCLFTPPPSHTFPLTPSLPHSLPQHTLHRWNRHTHTPAASIYGHSGSGRFLPWH